MAVGAVLAVVVGVVIVVAVTSDGNGNGGDPIDVIDNGGDPIDVIDNGGEFCEPLEAVLDVFEVNGERQLIWEAFGGCDPIGGFITACCEDGEQYAQFDVFGRSGEEIDVPPVLCETTLEIEYVLTLFDDGGQEASDFNGTTTTVVC